MLWGLGLGVKGLGLRDLRSRISGLKVLGLYGLGFRAYTLRLYGSTSDTRVVFGPRYDHKDPTSLPERRGFSKQGSRV